MELIKLTHENLDQEHICCAISNNREVQVISEKNRLRERLDKCIRDSKEKGKKGLVTLSSKKKMGFLSDPKYMVYKGF